MTSNCGKLVTRRRVRAAGEVHHAEDLDKSLGYRTGTLGQCTLKAGQPAQNCTFRSQPRQGCGVAWGCWSWHNIVRGWPPPLSIGKSFLNAGRALPAEVSRLSHCSKAKGRLSASGEQAPGGWKSCSPSRLPSLKKSTRWTHLCNGAVQLGPTKV